MRYTFFVMLRATPAWLRLTRDERRALTDRHLGGALTASPGIRVRHFDAEAFTAVCSDVMMVDTDDPGLHYFFMERLRDTPLIHVPYFEVVHIIPAVEDGFRQFERGEADREGGRH